MANYKARRHYRVAQKEVTQIPSKGTFVPTEKKEKLVALFVVILIAAYLKGILIGYMFGNRK